MELPTLAEVYVLRPLEVLSDGPASATLPAELTGALLDRWRAACAAYPPAGAFGASAARLVRHLLILPVRPALAGFRRACTGFRRAFTGFRRAFTG